MRQLRKIFVLILILCGLVSVGVLLVRFTAQKEPALCESCNVLIVSVETLGYKHTSLNGDLNTTPALAAFAKKAVSFERAYAQSPWTIPSHAAMFTGTYPWKLNIWNGADRLPSTQTLASKLSNAGYRTALFSNGFINQTFGFDQGFAHTYGSVEATTPTDDRALFSSALTWIKEHSNKPFFMIVHPAGVYLPYGSVSAETIASMHQKQGGPTETDQALIRTAYDQEVRSLDAVLGEFLEQVALSVDLSKTIIIVVSANGERFEKPSELTLHAASLSEEVLHVPFILSAPVIAPSKITATVETRSIYATVLDLVGVSTLEESLVPLLTGTKTSDRIVVAATAKTPEQAVDGLLHTSELISLLAEKEVTLARSNPAYTGTFSITSISGPWKILRTPDMKTTIYNVSEDPLEQIDRTDSLTPDARKVIGNLLLHLRI